MSGMISPLLDARPIRPTGPDTIWDWAARRRDEADATIRATLVHEKVEALVYVSEPGIFPPWVAMEAWVPVDRASSDTSRGRCRARLEVVIDAQPFNRTQLATTLRLTRGTRTIALEHRPDPTQSDIADWTRCALSPHAKPHNYRPWRDALLGFIGRSMPFLEIAHLNPVAPSYRMTWPARLRQNWPLIAGFGSSVVVMSFGLLGILLGLPILIATIVFAVRRSRRIVHATYVPEQPIDVPRWTGLVDSWHAVVAELGRDQDEVRRRLVACLSEKQQHHADIETRNETYGYRTPNGFEERQRLVLRKGQALVYVHLHSFGNDMFVGWHSYLNWSQWAETKAVSNRLEASTAIDYCEVRNFQYRPNHLDIIDLNSLGEFVHRRLERELKAIMKEKKIDQEIDFKVIRGDRGNALDATPQGEDKGGGKRRGGMRYVENAA